MNFTLSREDRHKIADKFLSKNDVDFGCITKHNERRPTPRYKIFVLFEDGFTDLQVVESLLYHNVTNFIQNSYWSALEKITLLFGLSTKKHLFYEEDFSILSESTKKHKFNFNIKTNRTDLTEKVFTEIGLDINSNRMAPIQQIIDELVMNAQLNAPKFSTSQNVNASLLIIEKNENLIAITVIDYYGTLDTKKFLKKIENSLKLGRGESINFSRGGAGLGGSIVYSHSDMILLGCIQQQKTRVTSVLPYNITENKYSYIQKSICIID